MPDKKEEFDAVIEPLLKNEAPPPDPAQLQNFRTGLGTILRGWFNSAERDRLEIEDEWLKDLRQFKGKYDPDVKKLLHPKRSKAFLSVTRTKVRTISARVCDILFPANGDRNWGISPTPVPDLDPTIVQTIAQQIIQITGQQPTEDQIRSIVFEEAKKRSDAMQKEISDQLSEIKYRDIIRSVIHSGNLYGSGILKGPLVKRSTSKRWVQGTEGWATISLNKVSPFCEFVPVWDIYPDMSVTNIDDCQYIFQRHKMPRHKLQGLASRVGFNSGAIKAYIKEHTQGDSTVKNYETDLATLSQDGSVSMEKFWAGGTTYSSRGGTALFTSKNKYDVLEFWGYVSSDLLREQGIEIPADIEGDVAANIWLVGDIVIKAVLSPIEGVTFPYFFYYFEKDETSVFGEGIPRIMRDPQSLFNASVRAMLDNAANAAGPYIEANLDLLDAAEDPTDLYPFRVFLRRGEGVESTAKAVNVYDIPSHTGEFLTMVEFFLRSADEVTTVPRYMHGDQSNVEGAGKTATGLSMLMGAANITIKDQIKNFDDGITKPFIKALYFWNMDFNSKENIKGDFDISAEGTTSLVAKEVMAEQLNTWLQVTNNPVDLALTNREVALRAVARAMDLTDMNLVKNPDQIRFEQESQAKSMETDRQFQREIELMKAKSSGHVGDDGATGKRPTMERLSPRDVANGEIPEVTTPDGQVL